MARLGMLTAELRNTAADVLSMTGATPHINLGYDVAVKRTGSASFKFVGAAAAAYLALDRAQASNRTYFTRAYSRWAGWPAANRIVAVIRTAVASDFKRLELTTTGVLRWEGSATGVQLTLNKWHRIEFSDRFNSAGTTVDLTLRVDGVTVETLAGLAGAGAALELVRFGYPAGGNVGDGTLYVDDCAINDDQGANQTSWPGDGRIYLLKPIADVAAGADWRRGDNSAVANGFDSINNLPPTGKADASAAAGDQLEDAVNAVASPAADMDFEVESPSEAGVHGAIALCQMIGSFAHNGTPPATMNTGLKLISNPTQAEDTVDTRPGVTAGGVWPANWATKYGTVFYDPAIDALTRPRLRVGKRQLTAQALMVSLAGLLVEEKSDTPSLRYRVTTTAAAAAIDPALPTFEAGDLLLMHLVSDDQNIALGALPAGWQIRRAQSGQDHRAFVLWRIAQAGDTAPHVLLSGSSNLVAIVGSYKDVNQTIPIDRDGGVTTNPAATNHVLPSITTSADADLVVALLSQDGNAGSSWTPPASMIERYDEDSVVGGRHLVLTSADERRPALGATGTRTFVSGVSEQVAGVILAIAHQLAAPVAESHGRPRLGDGLGGYKKRVRRLR